MIRVRTLPVAILVFVGVFGGVWLSVGLGYWRTTSSKEPVRISEGEFAGMPSPADIRGSYSWSDIQKAFGVDAAIAAAAFSSPGASLAVDSKVNQLEGLQNDLPPGAEIGTDSVRVFVALWTGLPLEPEEGTVLPAAAIEALVSHGVDRALAERYAIPSARAGESSESPATAAGMDQNTTIQAPGDTPSAGAGGEAHETSDRTVTGKTTIGDLYSWGVSESALREAFGAAPGSRGTSVRDFASSVGISFSELKGTLQALVDAAK